GTPFWCLLDIVPIKNEKRDVVLFLVSHKDITKQKDKQDKQDKADAAGANEDCANKNSDNDDSSDDDDSDDDAKDDDMPKNYDYGRRRSRAVLYHISGQLNKQNKAKSKLQQLNMLASQMPEYKVQEVKKSSFVIVHYGIFKIGWDWLILLCTVYIAIMVPFNAAFRKFDARKSGRFRDFMYIDAGVEVLFAIDIVLNFRTTYLNKSGQVVYESRLIAMNYISGWFVLDLLAAIPFDLLYTFSVQTATMVHLLKVARLLRLARLLQKLERYNQYSVLVLALLMCMFALVAHWGACIWYAIGKAELEDNDNNWTAGGYHNNSSSSNNFNILTSVGFGNVSANTNAEKIFSVCAMLMTLDVTIMYAAVFGNVTTIIQRMYARRATFHSKTKDLKDFFRIHHFPRQLKHRMRDYFQAMWSINNGIDFKQILKDFPEDMRGEIGLHLHREILSLPIFQQAPPGCLKGVALQTERLVCGPGEFIMHKGDAVNYLYYVCSGSMEVLKQEQVVAILGKGDIFGTDLDYDDPVSVSGCDVRSLAYCELLCIQVKGLVESLLLYPDYAETFNTELPNDLTYNVREGHEDHSDDESSTAAPVITLPSISEDEEEEDDKHNNNDDEVVCKERPTRLHNQVRRETDDEEGGGTPMSPLLSQFSREYMSSADWLASRGRLPNGHIANAISMRLANHHDKLKQWINKARRRYSLYTPSFLLTCIYVCFTYYIMLSVPLYTYCITCLNHILICIPLNMNLQLFSVSTERSIEQVMVHTLQMELEGTRDTVHGLERRLDDLHEDLSSISRNVSNLLRIVSQSPCPSMYHSNASLLPSHLNLHGNQLHPGYSFSNMAASCSPSPNPSSLYQTPTFYFSESTDGETTSGQMLLNQDGTGAVVNDLRDNHVWSWRRGAGFSSPSPLHSPRVNFTPSPMSSHFPSFPRTPASPGLSKTLADRGGPPPASSSCDAPAKGTLSRLNSGPKHRRARTPDAFAGSPSTFHNPSTAPSIGSPQLSGLARSQSKSKDLTNAAASGGSSTHDRVKPCSSSSSFPSPKSGRSQSPRPSNLPRGDVSQESPASASPLLGNACHAQEFQGEYYTLTQLEPCDGTGSGVCDKGSAMRRSQQELDAQSSP
ncbi:hypothetical protein EGW08_019580, partial [Elysia chlorotica]